MATEWYFEKNGNRQGPLSGSKLKQLAVSGQLAPDDLIWKDGMSDWKRAGNVKGLFENRPSEASSGGPPPVPKKPAKQEESSQVTQQLKSGASVIGASAKLANQLTAAQAEKTKIESASLPKAFANLGRHIVANAEQVPDLESMVREVKSIESQIESLAEQVKGQPEASTFTDKAKSLASKTGAAAQTKLLQRKLNQRLAQIGTKAIDGNGDWPSDLTEPVNQLRERLSNLTEEISGLKQQLSLQKEAAGQVVSNVAESGRGFLFKSGVVCTSAVMCAPFGLILIWLHPTWEKSRKLKWTVISVGIFFVMGVMVQMQKSEAREALAKADQVWESGDEASAIDLYRGVLDHWQFLSSGDRSRVFRRVIEFDCEHDNPESARKLIERARTGNVTLTLTSPAAQGLLAQIEEEGRTTSDKKQSSQNVAMGAESAPQSTNVTYEVSKGLFSGSLTIEISPDVAEYVTFEDFSWERSRLEFKMTRGSSLKYMTPRTDPWVCSAFDDEGVKLGTDPILFGGEIVTGQTVKAKTFTLDDETVRVLIRHR